MNDIPLTPQQSHELLEALAEQLAALGATYELLIIGGSALQALGLVDRPTSDVDVVGLLDGTSIITPLPLPAPLEQARDRVARDFGVPRQWLNPGPAELLDHGLPGGF